MEQPRDYEDRRPFKEWRFVRAITLGEIISLVCMLAGLYGYGTAILAEFRTNQTLLDKRVSIIEEKFALRDASQKETDRRQDDAIKDGQGRIEAQLAEIQRQMRTSSK